MQQGQTQRHRQQVADQPDLGAGLDEIDGQQVVPAILRKLVVQVEIGDQGAGQGIVAVVVVHVHVDQAVDEIGQDDGRQQGQ